MKWTSKNVAFSFLIFSMVILPIGCGGGGSGSDNSPQSGTQSDMARFYFDCDLQGLTGQLEMDIEVISSTGITWGPGPDPQITGVIGTGEYLIYTEGELNSPTGSYGFSGENQYADFWGVGTSERFLVEWVEESNGITMIVNPFGPQPTQYFCVMTDSERL
jgi:hypothetical protein